MQLMIIRIINTLKKEITEINDLEILGLEDIKSSDKKNEFVDSSFETISEVQESENWFDYLPASSKHFVGRDDIRNQILSLFNRIADKISNRRVFYLTGKSGWGKSSLIAEIRGRCRNKYYKKKYYVVAIDSRSALSPNFVALSFEKLINKAERDGFIEKDLFFQGITFTSNEDLVSSESVSILLKHLSQKGKYLILIFDQFEDIFRKSNLFKSFYKFLLDVNDIKSNLIVGFSWKTEILIPPENESYHLWQQAKELSESFEIQEFGSKEINGIINQLDKTIGKIGIELRRRLIESCQGYPWLTKKLCIHIYDQVENKRKKIENLIEENLNIETLFKSDLENLNPDEIKGLKYIAQRSFDGNFFDATEINDSIPENIVTSLINQRIIIKSGLNYNVYWDIFRDYLITDKVPYIGESYILRQSAKLCLEVFLLFSKDKTLTINELQDLHPRSLNQYTLENILIELRSIGLIKKDYGVDSYSLQNQNLKISEEDFSNYITNKLKLNTLYQKLNESKSQIITIPEIVITLKQTFKGYNFKDNTWRAYAKTLINWFYYSKLPIRNKIVKLQKGPSVKKFENRDELFLRTSPKELIKGLLCFFNKQDNYDNKHVLRDLYVLDIINKNKKITEIGNKILSLNEYERNIDLAKQCLTLPFMQEATRIYARSKTNLTTELFLNKLPKHILKGKKDSSKLIYTSKIKNWAKFILENIGDRI